MTAGCAAIAQPRSSHDCRAEWIRRMPGKDRQFLLYWLAAGPDDEVGPLFERLFGAVGRARASDARAADQLGLGPGYFLAGKRGAR